MNNVYAEHLTSGFFIVIFFKKIIKSFINTLLQNIKNKMSENQERKRTFWDIIITTAVGEGMLLNTFVTTKAVHKVGEEIAPRIQEYVGSICSGAVEYGLPGITCLAAITVGAIAVKATDQYLLNRK